VTQKRIYKEVKSSPKEDIIEDEPIESTSDATNTLKHDLDDILDEIDEVLETNAEEFVKSYRQHGGE